MKSQLIRIVAIAFFPVALLSCSNEADSVEKDKQFCKCLEVTGELNEFSAKMFDKETRIEDAQKMRSLRDEPNPNLFSLKYSMSLNYPRSKRNKSRDRFIHSRD